MGAPVSMQVHDAAHALHHRLVADLRHALLKHVKDIAQPLLVEVGCCQ